MLSTIQKREKLNNIYATDDIGPDGAHHSYDISNGISHKHVQFQKGPRNKEGSIAGVIDTDLLEIVRHRLQCFLVGPYSSRESALALTHVEEALMWLNRRVEDRIERDVFGKNEK